MHGQRWRRVDWSVSQDKEPFATVTRHQHLAVALSLVHAALLTPLTILTAGATVLDEDVEVTRGVQAVDWTLGAAVAGYGNWIGSTVGGLVIGALVGLWLLQRGHRAEALLVVAAVLLRVSNAILKVLSESPRPTPNLVRVTEQAGGAGFPSGHAMGAVLLCGALGVAVFRLSDCPRLRSLVAFGVVASVLATGFARVYVGAHWPSDVLGGVMWGSALVAILAYGLYWATERWPGLNGARRLV